MRTPRVVHVVLSLSPGGTERLVVDLVRVLGPEVATGVCCLDDAGRWARDVEQQGIAVTSLQRAPGFRPGLSRQIAAFARRHRADVLHCHHYSPFVYGRLAALWRNRLRVVFTEHGRLSNGGPSRKRQLVNVLVGRLPAVCCAVSEDLKQHMVAEGFSARRLRVVHNGIDPGPAPSLEARLAGRQAVGMPLERFVVGTVARLDPVKDLGTLVRGFSRLAAQVPEAELVVVGDGAERAALETIAKEIGVGDRTRFVGARDDARALLPGFDVYVNSSTTEGVSVTILEAMAAGVPVVATRVGGTPEVITNADTGVLVRSGDPDALAEALARIAGMPGRAQEMAARARRRVETTFGLDRMVDEYRALYVAAAEGRF